MITFCNYTRKRSFNRLQGAACALVVCVLVTPGSPTRASEPNLPTDIEFEWRPAEGPRNSYNMPEKADRHRIIITSGVKRGVRTPVVIGFHGQPKRGKPPQDYKFVKQTPDLIKSLVAKGEVQPFVFVMPVFRFYGQNWPGFDVRAFRKEVEKHLEQVGVQPGDWYLFGHSGAAGCGGDGLNQAHRMAPKAVGFFDTCLGRGWQDAVKQLRKQKIDTVNIHSVETAGFRPRQRPEYQSTFDFGRAYRPLGLAPIPCPKVHPGKRLRDQPFRCAATPDKVVQAFVVDTGEGQPAHEALLPVAIAYFLKHYLGGSK